MYVLIYICMYCFRCPSRYLFLYDFCIDFFSSFVRYVFSWFVIDLCIYVFLV